MRKKAEAELKARLTAISQGVGALIRHSRDRDGVKLYTALRDMLDFRHRYYKSLSDEAKSHISRALYLAEVALNTYGK